jgi:RHS repeat-associated protein
LFTRPCGFAIHTIIIRGFVIRYSSNHKYLPNIKMQPEQSLIFLDCRRRSATLSYGINHQRVKMELSQDGSTLNRIYAHGNYEEETGSTNRKIHYISTGDGVSAMYISNTGNNGNMYYIYKDHLGSVNVITDENGTVVEEHSFDAWGRRRNHANWGYENINIDGLTYRGYTGHEHLDQFGMINMNGRVYDPIIDRFLSPEKYVQASQFAQSFNWYSYCFNNPF